MIPQPGRRVLQSAVCLVTISVFAAHGTAQPLVAPTEALSAAEQQKRFHLPPGFEIQLFACEPAIHKPMNFTFDGGGRLFVTDTLEYPYPAKADAMPRDTVKVLTDRDHDGTADEVTTFVDRLNIPLGVMPIPRGVLVYGIGGVMRCLDTNGDGKADTRDVLLSNFGHRDTHGMVNSFTRGLDGWLYACHGFSNDSSPRGSDGQTIKMNSGNTFRMRLDGSHVEYFTHGQVNPFGLAFDPLGNLYSADCHTMPIYALLRGAYYPSFGKAHDGLGFGPTMIDHNHGSSGIGGIAYYAADHFPPEYRDTIMIGNPVTGRVNHDRLRAHGSTYEAVELPDFVSCDDPWFRPVYLQVGPDGALYIADFYNRIIGHYEVPLEHPGRDRERGRIWRVVYTGKGVERVAKTRPPIATDLGHASPARLVEMLDDPNLTVRTLATHELVDRVGRAAVEPLKSLLASRHATPRARIHAMWALERIEPLDWSLVDRLVADADRGVRVHALKLLAERSADDCPQARAALSDPDPFVRRAAADVLGRRPRIENVKPLLDLWTSTAPEDTHLIHVARMALRDQLLKPGNYAQLTGVVGADRADLDRLAEVSLGVGNVDSAAFVWQQLQANPATGQRDALVHHVARHIAADKLDELYAASLKRADAPWLEQAGRLRSLSRGAQERGAEVPEEIRAWAARLAGELLGADDEARVRTGIELARELRPPVFEALSQAAAADARFAGLRTAAMDACVANDAPRSVSLLVGVLANAAEPMNLRQHSAAALARVNSELARQQLLANLQTAPQRLAVEIAGALSDSGDGAEGLLAAIESGKASPRLLQEPAVMARLRARKLQNLDERLSKVTAGLPPQDDRVRELIDQRRKLVAGTKAESARGAAVFEKHCAVCHRIGEKGAKIGPNLDGVGIRGLDRLLEDILDPNRNVDQAFRATQVVANGRVLSGLALRDEGQILILADAQGKEVRVPQAEIEERTTSGLSPMPANVPDLVSEEDFAHLVGYLLSQREKPPAAK